MDIPTNPRKGDRIKILFKNRSVEEGIVLFWTDEKAVVKALYSDNILIIYSVLENVQAVQIFCEKEKPQVAVDTELEPQEYIKDHKLRVMKLAELHQLRAQEERNNAKALLTTFKPTGEIKRPYGEGPTIPRVISKPIRLGPSKKG